MQNLNLLKQLATLQESNDKLTLALAEMTAERDALKAAAVLALEAIYELQYSSTTVPAQQKSEKAIEALREALY
jgi:hypothetical protein